MLPTAIYSAAPCFTPARLPRVSGSVGACGAMLLCFELGLQEQAYRRLEIGSMVSGYSIRVWNRGTDWEDRYARLGRRKERARA